MKKKRVNSEKGKVMNGHRLSEMERTKNSDSHLYIRFCARAYPLSSQFFELELCQQPRKLGALA